MGLYKSILAEADIFAREIKVNFVIQDIIGRLYASTARKKGGGYSTVITARDGSVVGFMRISPDDSFYAVLCRECLITDFLRAAKIIGNAKKCTLGIA